jgi:hypothetical protein
MQLPALRQWLKPRTINITLLETSGLLYKPRPRVRVRPRRWPPSDRRRACTHLPLHRFRESARHHRGRPCGHVQDAVQARADGGAAAETQRVILMKRRPKGARMILFPHCVHSQHGSKRPMCGRAHAPPARCGHLRDASHRRPGRIIRSRAHRWWCQFRGSRRVAARWARDELLGTGPEFAGPVVGWDSSERAVNERPPCGQQRGKHV